MTPLERPRPGPYIEHIKQFKRITLEGPYPTMQQAEEHAEALQDWLRKYGVTVRAVYIYDDGTQYPPPITEEHQ